MATPDWVPVPADKAPTAPNPGGIPTYKGEINPDRLILAERLRRDALVTTRGSRAGRITGASLIVMAFVLGLADRRLVQVEAANWIGDTDITLLMVGLILGIIGLGVLLACVWLPRNVRMAVPVADKQVAEWHALRQRLRGLRTWFALAWSLIGVAILTAAYGVVVALPEDAVVFVAVGALAGLAGLALMLMAATRRPLLQKLVVQTMMLSALEKSGIWTDDGQSGNGRDPRIGPVLRHLDTMLASLPDNDVQAFLTSPVAKDYLALVEEHGGQDDGEG